MKTLSKQANVAFYFVYTATSFILGSIVIIKSISFYQFLAGSAGILLGFANIFLLVIKVAIKDNTDVENFAKPLSFANKMNAAIMSLMYVMLWKIGLISLRVFLPLWISLLMYILAGIRILLCFGYHNKNLELKVPLQWILLRNIPYFIQNIMVIGLFFLNRNQNLSLAWIALSICFICYFIRIFLQEKQIKSNLFAIPESIAYIWLISMFL